jgi:regulator of nonsense transcripts 2
MRTQQQAEKAEQQRIKNLVLNYDLTDDQQDGESPSFHYVQSSHNPNSVRLVGMGSLNSKGPKMSGQIQHSTKREAVLQQPFTVEATTPSNSALKRQDSLTDESGPFDTLHGAPRYDKSGNTRSKQRARKLQLGDIDWYDDKKQPTLELQQGQTSLDQYVVDKKSTRGGRGGGARQGDRRTG